MSSVTATEFDESEISQMRKHCIRKRLSEIENERADLEKELKKLERLNRSRGSPRKPQE